MDLIRKYTIIVMIKLKDLILKFMNIADVLLNPKSGLENQSSLILKR